MGEQLALFEVAEPDPRAKYTTATAIVPREYQAAAVDNTYEGFATSVGCLVRLHTGAGKTIVGSLIAERWLAMGDEYRVLVIGHERQLVWQFRDELRDVLVDVSIGVEMGTRRVQVGPTQPRVVIASRATLLDKTIEGDDGEPEVVSRVHKFDNKLNWLVIWDEAHKNAYGLRSVGHVADWFAVNDKSKRVGLTATPERTDGQTIESMFPYVASDFRLYDAKGGPCGVSEGYAVPYDQRYITVDAVDFEKIETVKGDYDQVELDRILKKQEVVAGMVEPLLDLVEDRQTLVFCTTIESAKETARYINSIKSPGADVDQRAARTLDGTIDEAIRRKAYADHQAARYQFLVVVGLCREGYNDRGISAIGILRPTKSRPLAEQMKGRGCRPLKGVVDGLATAEERRQAIANSSKPNCLIVDLVGATGLGDCASTAAIYAEGQPDEVIRRADEIALDLAAEGSAVDMAEVVDQAIKDVARLAAAEAERIAQERADQDARLAAKVRYEQRIVEHGGTSGRLHGNAAAGCVMPFGKHKGKDWSEVPDGYKRWMKSEMPGRYWSIVRRAAAVEKFQQTAGVE